jgi:hypothetical protein
VTAAGRRAAGAHTRRAFRLGRQLNLPIGLAAAIGLVLLAGRGGRRRTILTALLFVCACVIVVFVVGLWFIEWSSFKALLNFHASVMFHSGAVWHGTVRRHRWIRTAECHPLDSR